MSESSVMHTIPNHRLSLPQVTLCAVSSSNLAATIRALEVSLAQISFGEAILFTDADLGAQGLEANSEIRVVQISKLNSAKAYSEFLLTKLVDYVKTDHCLIVQWDGHVLDAARWRPEFLDYDYIGASWPQFGDDHDVGNGGFSFRSRKLMEACLEPEFKVHHPEDIAICRTNRPFMDARQLLFAPAAIADEFAAERAGDPASSFGFHGVFLMPRVLGADGFWQIYRTLDERSSLWRDHADIMKGLKNGSNSFLRSLWMGANRIADFARGMIR